MKQSVFRFDTETYPIRPGLLAPRLVCLQSALDLDTPDVDGTVSILLHDQVENKMQDVLSQPGMLLEAFNGAFDFGVLCGNYPHLTPLVFRALGQARGRDVWIREILHEINNGTLQDKHPKGWFSLAGVAKRRVGLDLDKSEDSWRLRYALLDGKPVSNWPADAVAYAEGDVTALRTLSRVYRTAPYQPPDEWLQVAAAFCLQLAAIWGVRVDADRAAWVETALLTQQEESAQLLEQAGLFADGSVQKAKVVAAVERACAAAGKPVPKTKPSSRFPHGQTQATAEVCEDLAPYDPVLTQLSEHRHAGDMLTKYVRPLSVGAKYACTSRPNILVASGRTSWSGSVLTQTNPWWPRPPDGFEYQEVEERAGTNMQNFPREEGIRDLIKPRDGFLWLSVDYDSLELRILGQITEWICGHSRMAESYREDPDFDPHSALAATLMGISYEQALALKAQGDKKLKAMRGLAKIANFGFMGGLGPPRFVEYAKSNYGVEISLADAYALKEAWLKTWPEMGKYFEWAGFVAETNSGVDQFVSGRHRGGTGFCDTANTTVQGLAADGFKRALIHVSQACYVEPDSPLFGCRVVAGIHDELCLEVHKNTAHEAAMECKQLMELEMQTVAPRVPIRATPALSTYWIKAAEPVWTDGRLQVWG